MFKWIKDNKTLLTIVLLLWLVAGIAYYATIPSIGDLNQREKNIIQYAADIINKTGTQIDKISGLLNEIKSAEDAVFWRGIIRSISSGFFVAGIMILAVDIHTKRQTKNEVEEYRNSVASDVWRAVSGRLLTEEICNEIDNILKSELVRTDCQYTIILKEKFDWMSDNLIIVQRRLSYTAINLTNRDKYEYDMQTSFRSPHILKRDVNGETKTVLPCHTECKIDGVLQSIEDCVTQDSPLLLKRKILLPKTNKSGKKIYLDGQEACWLHDQNTYVFGSCTIGLTINVINELKDRIKIENVTVNHPRSSELTQIQPGVWKMGGGFIPGQSFVVRWGPI